MKILLVRPKPPQESIGLQSVMICEPLELEYLAAAVKENHQVELVDMILERKPFSDFVCQYKPQVVAMTAYITHVQVVKEYSKIIKGINSDIKTIVGGVHAEVVPEDFLDDNIDYVVNNDGINTFKKLIGQLDEEGEDLTITTSLKHEPSIFPDRQITARYRHKYYYMFHQPCALIKTSYGCPFTCTFCFCREITGGSYFVRDLNNVIEEIKEINEPEIYIVDDNFLVDPQRVIQFCGLLKENGIKKKFLIYGRADFIAQHEEVIAMFAQVGLRAVIVGVESPKPEDLQCYDKGSTVEINEKAISILHKLEIDCYATLILGVDWGQEDFDRLGQWLKQNKLRFVNLQPLTPLPGTAIYEKFASRITVPRNEYAKWDFANLILRPTKLSLRKYYFNILKLYFKITLSPDSMAKNIRYGLGANLKLIPGIWRINFQYLAKIFKGS